MTTIITRLYSDKAAALAVAQALHDIGLAADEVAVVDGGDASARLRALRLAPKDAAAIAAGIARGHAAVVATAPFNPRGIALKATRLMDAHNPAAAADRYVEEDYRPVGRSNLYPAGTYFMSIPPEHRGGASHGHVLSLGGLTSTPTKTSAAGRARHILPFATIKRSNRSLKVSHWSLSRMLGMPTIADR
ncbi:MAG: hypothetical protein ACT4OK_09355 [Gemmobacter sp.]